MYRSYRLDVMLTFGTLLRTVFNGSRYQNISIDISIITLLYFAIILSQILWINSHDTFDLSDTT